MTENLGSGMIPEIRKVGMSESRVLITGESGTGKEVVARQIFEVRARGGFVKVDCASMTSSLIGSELFGSAKGSYTSSVRDARGLVEEAHGGTLFLDEVGELPLDVQPKILRIVQEGEYRPLGTTLWKRSDCRIIAATKRDLRQMVTDGEFREDLYYRLDVIRIELKPLRDRVTEIDGLIDHFLAQHCNGHQTHPVLSTEAFSALHAYRWPGNIRELSSVLEKALLRAVHPAVIMLSDLPDEVRQSGHPQESATVLSFEEMKRSHVFRILEMCGGERRRSAGVLGVSEVTLYRWLKQWGQTGRKAEEA
jgi:transcriptional regulator with PAS, ATPase and Fis domain